MKVSIAKSELVAAVSTAIRAAASRPSIPSLSGILISTDGGQVTLFASDLETSIKTQANGMIEETGSVAVPGRIFSDIVRSLPDAAVTLEQEGEMLRISCNQSTFTIHTIPVADFTRFPDISGIDTVSLPQDVLASMVKKVSKAVSRDETRAILTGVLLTIQGPSVKMAATDSYRLAVVDRVLETAVAEKFEVLVPGRALDEVSKLSAGSSEVVITVSSNQIVFKFGGTEFVTRRLEGNFPSYDKLIPREWKVRATANLGEIADSVKRASLLAPNNAAIKLVFSEEDQTLALSSRAVDLGGADEQIMVKVEGGAAEIAFNHSFIQDGLSVIESDFITIEVTEANRPGIIRSSEEGFIYLMMPVRAN